MKLHFRKSVNLGGGMKLNLSKSGVGISGGVKGARLSVGPRGTFFSGGKNGIYFREKIGGRKSSIQLNKTSNTYTIDNVEYKPLPKFKRFLYIFFGSILMLFSFVLIMAFLFMFYEGENVWACFAIVFSLIFSCGLYLFVQRNIIVPIS